MVSKCETMHETSAILLFRPAKQHTGSKSEPAPEVPAAKPAKPTQPLRSSELQPLKRDPRLLASLD